MRFHAFPNNSHQEMHRIDSNEKYDSGQEGEEYAIRMQNIFESLHVLI